MIRIILMIVLLPTLAQAVTRYVALTGVDTGGCTSAGSPCRHIQYAMNQAVAGDVVQVAAGCSMNVLP